MEFRLRSGADPATLVRAVADLRGPQATTGAVNLVSGFVPSLWRGLGGHLPDDVRPPTSHVSRTVLEEDGRELEIFRRNTPFGSAVEHGTMFVGFSIEQRRLHRMLERMVGLGDGIRDALTDYATPLTGAYYFVPSIEALRTFAKSGA